MTGWTDLDRELDLWAEAGRTATFWWRDDDAIAPEPGLKQLLTIARECRVAPMLAVIPARAFPALGPLLLGEPVAIAQHGYHHDNHAWRFRHKAEYGPNRPIDYMLGELARGAALMDGLFGTRWLRVIVPPFNRITSALVEALAGAGYVGLSRDGPRQRAPTPGFIEMNTHIDIMDWKVRAFGGEAAAVSRAIRHLAARREDRCDRAEPTGLLTHHRAHDAGAWTFTAAFLDRVSAHRAARWIDAADAFAPAARAGAHAA